MLLSFPLISLILFEEALETPRNVKHCKTFLIHLYFFNEYRYRNKYQTNGFFIAFSHPKGMAFTAVRI